MSENNLAVYTAVFNDYDVLLQPKIIPEGVDFICFTDNPSRVPEPWIPRDVQRVQEQGKVSSSRLKIQPHKYLSEYTYSIWVDGNIHIIGDITRYLDKIKKNKLILPTHPTRNCVYDEGVECIKRNKSGTKETINQLNKYHQAGLPNNYRLHWTGILFRRHNDPAVISLMESWWEAFKNGTNRDQLSLTYAIWKTDIEYTSTDIEYHSERGIFKRIQHRPSGLSGRLWERTIKYREKRDGIVKTIGLSIASSVYYLNRGITILRQDGFDEFLSQSQNTIESWLFK